MYCVWHTIEPEVGEVGQGGDTAWQGGQAGRLHVDDIQAYSSQDHTRKRMNPWKLMVVDGRREEDVLGHGKCSRADSVDNGQ